MGEARKAIEERARVVNDSPRARRLLKSWKGVIQVEVIPEAAPFHITVTEDSMAVAEGTHHHPDMVLQGSAEAFARVARCEVDITHPIARGQLRVGHGRVADTIHFSRIIQASRRAE